MLKNHWPLVILALAIFLGTQVLPENYYPFKFTKRERSPVSDAQSPLVYRTATEGPAIPELCPGNTKVEPIRVDELAYGFDCDGDLKVDVEWWKAEKVYIFFADTREKARAMAKPLRCVTEESDPATKGRLVVCDPHTIEYFGRNEAQGREAQARFDRAPK